MTRFVRFVGATLAAFAVAVSPAIADEAAIAPSTPPPGYTINTWEEDLGYAPNIYTISQAIPEYLTSAMRVTVDAAGPTPICYMRLGDQTVRTAPFQFFLNPRDVDEAFRPRISVYTCATGYEEQIADLRLNTTVPFEVTPEVISDSKRDSTVQITSNVEAASQATVKLGSTIIQTAEMGPLGTAEISLPSKTGKRTSTYTVEIAAENGVTMTIPVAVARGWSILGYGHDLRQIYAPCQTVAWYYDDKGAPKGASTGSIKKDIAGSLRRISNHASLSFVEVEDPAAATLVFSWENVGKRGPAAVGGHSNWIGGVVFNSRNSWPTDKYAGFKAFTPYRDGGYIYTRGPAGRGWLIIHETMHAMGLGHVDDPKSIMSPVNSGQGKFTRGDIEGLQFLYPQVCSLPQQQD